MSNKNTKCKQCGTLYHTCSGCSFTHDWEYTYCSDKCHDERRALVLAELSAKYNISGDGIMDIVERLEDEDVI